MSILWEKSETWRWIVRKTRDSKSFFFTFATVCGVVPGVIGYCVMQLTNSRNPELEARLRQNARPESLVRSYCIYYLYSFKSPNMLQLLNSFVIPRVLQLDLIAFYKFVKPFKMIRSELTGSWRGVIRLK